VRQIRHGVGSLANKSFKGKIKEAIKIIKDEKLQGYNMNEERYNRENEVVLRCENDKWIVYATDERASKVTNSQDIYFDEEEALDNFIDRLRALNRLRGYKVKTVTSI